VYIVCLYICIYICIYVFFKIYIFMVYIYRIKISCSQLWAKFQRIFFDFANILLWIIGIWFCFWFGIHRIYTYVYTHTYKHTYIYTYYII